MDSQHARQSEAPGESARRAYEPPAIAWEEDFTPYAFSACGKMQSQGVVCNNSRMS